MYRITLHSYMHYHHCILTCITIIWHSYMYYCHVAFLHALPLHRILTCVTIILHRILTCVTIILHLHSFIHYHAFHLHQKNSFHLFCPENIKLSTQRTFRTPRMSQRAIDELQRGQELLKAEVKHLKSQMSLVMDLLQVVLKRECNTTPISASLVAALSSDVSMSQGHPHVENSPIQNFPTEHHPRPSPSKIPRRQQLLTPRSKKKGLNQHINPHYRRYAQQDIQPIPIS